MATNTLVRAGNRLYLFLDGVLTDVVRPKGRAKLRSNPHDIAHLIVGFGFSYEEEEAINVFEKSYFPCVESWDLVPDWALESALWEFDEIRLQRGWRKVLARDHYVLWYDIGTKTVYYLEE